MAAQNSTKSALEFEKETNENSDIPFLTLVICYTIFSLTIIGYALLEGKNIKKIYFATATVLSVQILFWWTTGKSRKQSSKPDTFKR